MPETASSRRDLSVVAILVSVFVSAAAALAQATVLGKQIYDLTGRELDLGLLGLAEFAPAALLVLVTGSAADRFDRRRVAAVGFAGEALVAGALSWYAGTDPTAVGPIFALAFAFGVARAFAAPAIRSLPADIVAPDRLPWLVARFSGGWQAALIVGPVLGGFLYTIDIRLPYIAAMVLLLLAAGSISLVRRPVPATVTTPGAREALVLEDAASEPVVGHSAVDAGGPSEKASFRDAIEGLAFIRRHPVLLGAISLDLFAVLFGGAVALLPAIATDRLGVDAVGLGWLRAAGGLGAGLVTVGLAVRPVRRNVGRVLLVAVATFGVTTIALGLTHSFVLAFLALAILSGADSVSVFIRATLVPLVTPEEKRGRVMAVENVFIGASNELGAFESGVVGQILGPAGAVVVGGIGTLLIATGWWFLFPDLRRVDRFPDGPSVGA
ncbi:MAG TPA: MFS transporter [Acidimicrobiales bacterium]|nr:MFS transporter [Acidimicrobiales bacterium]